ncbi:hypothetical protein [Kaistia nematophila]|uniref:Uncharacterized protein n=1 Tax=Kaistia nematophila TaxID=2994654 RepID=A0A9X3E8G7_9HYPH|nr:hypothetical protein [Kaistia nematophila]MCX5571408.1 hypothetical protein [Kaistia nematophila]
MQRVARYIEDLSDELSHLARQHEMHDLAYLLRMAAEEARATAERTVVMAPVKPAPTRSAQDCPDIRS